MKKNCFITLGLVTLLGFVVIFTGCKEVSPKKPDICSFSIKSDYSECNKTRKVGIILF